LMIRANVLFYEITGEARWLAEAQRLARAAETHWVDPATGAIRDGGRFAHLLVDALLALHAADHDPHWLKVSQRALGYLHGHLRDEAGRYSGRWDRPASDRRRGMTLLDQASAARAFLVTAEALRNATPLPSPK
jgi:mannose/cellobiose epimerase-like protein (N-acyl-D-glucosamine 2-epimerase family)